MFGLTEHEMETFLSSMQSFAIQEAAHSVVTGARFMTPATQKGEKLVPDTGFFKLLVTDIETIITLTATSMAYEYAHLQHEAKLGEHEIVKHLHTKYDTNVLNQFIKYGLVSTTDVIPDIVGTLVLELPYIYAEVREDEEFSEDDFLAERLEAYDEYLDTNFYTDDFEGLDDYECDCEDGECDCAEEEIEIEEEDFEE
jgi:hypothetical protein